MTTLQERLKEAAERSRIYVVPPPNTDACSVYELKLGQHDWRIEIEEWHAKNRKRIERAVRKGEYVDWRADLGAAPTDMLPIYCDPNIPRGDFPEANSAWRADEFEMLVMGSGKIMAKTMTVVRAGIDNGQVLQLASMIERLFADEYVPSELTLLNSMPSMRLPYPNLLLDPKRTITMFKLRCANIIARFIVGAYLNDAGAWIENASTIADYLPPTAMPDMNAPPTTLPDMDLDDDPVASATALANTIERSNRRASGTAISSLADMDDMF